MFADPPAVDVCARPAGGPQLVAAIDADPIGSLALDVVSFVVGQAVVVPAFLLGADEPAGSSTAAVSALAVDLGGRAFVLADGIFGLLLPGEAQQSTVLACLETVPGYDAAPTHARVLLPFEARDGRAALRLAFDRLAIRAQYHHASPGRQVRSVLLELLQERAGGGHGLHRTAVVSDAVAVGRRLCLSPGELEDLARAAEFQDLGLVLQPSVTAKGTLDQADRDLIGRHPLLAERVLCAAPSMGSVGRIVRSSYERFDGAGYPDGLAGPDIPVSARIVAVCVAFHAMTSARPYRPALTRDVAVQELRSCAGLQFDPELVELLVDIITARDY